MIQRYFPNTFFGWSQDLASMTLNGHSSVYVTPRGGAESSVGYVADPIFKLTPINEDTTFGMATVGFNASIIAKAKSTAPGDITAAIAAREAINMRVIGPVHTATLTNLFVAITVQKGFGNKAGESFIELNGEYPGMAPTVAQTIVTTST